MKIKELGIYGYGKWHDFTLQLSENLTVFLGNNEAGKSTLIAFIESILFGFPRRNELINRYEPISGERYGGYLILETAEYGEVKIERTRGKLVTGQLKITDNGGTTYPESFLNNLLNQFDRNLYHQIYGITLTDLEDFKQLSPEKIHEYFTSLGATGSKQAMQKIESLEKAAADLFKYRGRKPEINVQLKKMEETDQKIQKLKANYADYQSKKKEIYEIELKLTDLSADLDELSQLKDQLPRLRQQAELVKQISAGQEALLSYQDLKVTSEMVYQFRKIKDQLAEIDESLNELRLQLDEKGQLIHLPQEYLNSDFKTKYELSQQHINALKASLDKLSWYLEEMSKKTEEFHDIAQLISFDSDIDQAALPELFDEEQLDIFDQWKTDDIQLSQKIDDESRELDYLHERDIEMSAQLERLSENIEEDEEERVDSFPVQTWHYVLFGFLVLGFLFYSLYTGRTWGQLLGMLLTVLWVIIFAKNFAKQQKNQAYWSVQNEISQLKEALKRNMSERRKLAAKLMETKTAYFRIHTQYVLLKKDHQWKADIKLYQARDYQSKLIHLKKIQSEWLTFDKKVAQERKAIKDWLEKYSFVPFNIDNEAFPEKQATDYLKELEKVDLQMSGQKPILSAIDDIHQRIEAYQADQSRLHDAIQELIAMAEVSDEEELQKAFEKLTEKSELEKQLNWQENQLELSEEEVKIAQNLPEYENKLNQSIIEKEMHKNDLHKKLTELSAKRLQLAQDGTYEQALNDFEMEKAQMTELMDRWISIQLAIDILKLDMKAALDSRYPKLQETVIRFFEHLTNGQYIKVNYQNDQWFVMREDQQVFGIEALSRGTVEPLYLSFRLAFALINADLFKLPLIVDDAFVNFDQNRRQSAIDLLKELSKEIQILYFTFQPIEDAPSLDIINLNELTI